ncbi:MAG: signal recognition particle-docking protein FtsY [Nanoarchaeota archaeon]
MFGKLKEKLKSWAKNLSKKAEKTEEDGKTLKKSSEKSEKIKEIPLPMKFEVGKEKFEPDLEALKEKVEGIKKETKTLKKHAKEKELEEKVHEIEEKEEIEEKQGFFAKLKSKITKAKISEKDFEEYEEDLKMILLENNVAYEVSDKIIKSLKRSLVNREILKKELDSEIKDSLRDSIENILVDPFSITDKIMGKKEKPYVILFCGINGTGKTTTIAKIANLLQKSKLSCVLAAADTFRAASIEQIKVHAEKLSVKLISHDYGADPASVGFDSISYAKKNKIDCVLIDTAGRMHSEKNLLKELEKISRVCKPDLKLFVGEAITGNDSVEQIKAFNSSISIDGIILAKADIDEKGGTALSLGYITKKPILYLGTGQKYSDLEIFDKKKFVEKLGL